MRTIPNPTQARSRQALERYIKVTIDLLAQNRFEDTSIAQIARLANSSVGTFYRLLADKDVLLCAVHERFVDDSHQVISDLVESLGSSEHPFQEQLKQFVRGIIGLYDGNEGLLRALIRRSSVDERFRERIHQLNFFVGHSLRSLVLKQRDQLSHPAPENAADLAGHVLLASMNYYSLVGTLGDTPRDHLPEELSLLICNYLQLR
ncbi:TetR/AcrR family transcriptional regulator [Halopseudomonas maritima]|uniref:TetR/AcrR family transcriptional regulator n=1 Tax=Halopseudomonas maritima TaxID=2918528 RepID=UPI001EEACEC6|nr:TetR/AcrR family transcriptional regulator [Halopseudomonas maritima]UJJ32322.1 TetR/AcrR family transcriptional regulator [Halopseudomonas maritima]